MEQGLFEKWACLGKVTATTRRERESTRWRVAGTPLPHLRSCHLWKRADRSDGKGSLLQPAHWLPAPCHSQSSFLLSLQPNTRAWPGRAGPHCTYGEKQQYDRLETVCRLEKLIITSVCLRNLISPALTHSLFSHPSAFTPRAPRTS